MNGLPRTIRTSAAKAGVGIAAGLAGFALAALVGVAVAKTFTLKVGNGASVTNQAGRTQTENIALTSSGFAVYTLTGDSKAHPECTKSNGCFGFWPPVTVSSRKSLSKASGIRGNLGLWHRDGFLQVMLGGHPLYRYAGDSRKADATGEGIRTFGGTWHVVKTAGSSGSGTTTSATMPTTTTTMTTTTTCAYPPYC